MKRLFLVVTLFVLLTAQALAEIKAIDIRQSENEEVNSWFIGFVSKVGVPGHAFVIWGVEDKQKKASYIRAFGFYPAKDNRKDAFKLGALPGDMWPTDSLPGQIIDETKLHGNTDTYNNIYARMGDMLLVKVDPDAYKRSEQVLSEWTEKDFNGKPYELLSSDCVTFVKAVGESIGLTMPNRSILTPDTYLPVQFIRALIDSVTKSPLTEVQREGDFVGGYINGKAFGRGKFINEVGTYEGFFKNGDIIKGQLQYRDGYVYEGLFSNMLPSGEGKLTTRNSVFEGQWDSGSIKEGTLTTTTGFGNTRQVYVYRGPFDLNREHGKGLAYYANGDEYFGYFRHGKRHGRGLYTAENGDTYHGDFEDGKFNGDGYYSFKKGSSYSGQFLDNEFHGKGTYRFGDGRFIEGSFRHGQPVSGKYYGSDDHYEGEFEDWAFNGEGKYRRDNGTRIEGHFKNNVLHGSGTVEVSDHTKTTGTYQNGVLHGQGTTARSNGEVYKGNFKDGRWEGRGTYSYPDGTQIEGEFKDNKLFGIVEYRDSNGMVIAARLIEGLIILTTPAPTSSNPTNPNTTRTNPPATNRKNDRDKEAPHRPERSGWIRGEVTFGRPEIEVRKPKN